MALEEVVEGISLDILFTAKHRYRLETNPPPIQAISQPLFWLYFMNASGQVAIKDNHSVPLLSVVLEIVYPELFQLPKTNIG